MLNTVAADRALSNMGRWRLYALITIVVGGLSVVDYLTGFKLSFAIFYLVPTALATWYGSRRAGRTTAFLSFMLSVTAGLINTRSSPEEQLIVLWNGVTPLALYLVIVFLLSKLKTRLELEQRLARTDHLTGCMNAHAFMPMLQYHFDLAARDHQPITLAYIDLDDFKSVNDTSGHDEGDRVLKLVSRIWLESCRRTDLVARLGGDEFCILFPNTDQRGAARIISKARDTLAAAFASARVAVTCSIGVVTFPAAVLDTKQAIKAADMLMYRAKTQGKDSTVFSIFDPSQNRASAADATASAAPSQYPAGDRPNPPRS